MRVGLRHPHGGWVGAKPPIWGWGRAFCVLLYTVSPKWGDGVRAQTPPPHMGGMVDASPYGERGYAEGRGHAAEAELETFSYRKTCNEYTDCREGVFQTPPSAVIIRTTPTPGPCCENATCSLYTTLSRGERTTIST